MGGTTPRQVVLGYIRKQTEELVSKQCSSMASGAVPASEFLPYLSPALTSLNNGLRSGQLSQVNPFLPRLFLIRVLYHGKRNETGLSGFSLHTGLRSERFK